LCNLTSQRLQKLPNSLTSMSTEQLFVSIKSFTLPENVLLCIFHVLRCLVIWPFGELSQQGFMQQNLHSTIASVISWFTSDSLREGFLFIFWAQNLRKKIVCVKLQTSSWDIKFKHCFQNGFVENFATKDFKLSGSLSGVCCWYVQ
jgi:hypothetical protein